MRPNEGPKRPPTKPAAGKKRPTTAREPSPLFDEARQLRLKKSFAQHFLVDQAVHQRIVDLMTPEPKAVLEIGPGAGFLTQAMLGQGFNVTGVEIERDAIAYLSQKFANRPHFALVASDFLKYDVASFPADTFQVVGNLPYNLSTPILFHLVGELACPHDALRERISQMVLMVQWEVGQRLAAQAGTPGYNALSIATQWGYHVELGFKIPPKAFYPPPKVDSAVVRLTPRTAPPADVHDLKLLGQLVQGVFRYRRKTIANGLKHSGLIAPDAIASALEHAGIAPTERPERLDIQAFTSLANHLADCRKADKSPDATV
jgi:16S rRNA (adenine1518-N6/adenine1519-N6)-dimethyltransferase